MALFAREKKGCQGWESGRVWDCSDSLGDFRVLLLLLLLLVPVVLVTVTVATVSSSLFFCQPDHLTPGAILALQHFPAEAARPGHCGTFKGASDFSTEPTECGHHWCF